MSQHSGFVLIDKPLDWTSHDIVAKLRGVLGTRKIGHGGTLDPLASGLLVLGVNQGTKLLRYILALPKTYETVIRLGQTTPTDDAAVDIDSQADPERIAAVSDAALATAVSELTGKIQQRPSSFSAIKVQGKRAYELARKGEAVDLPARPVTVHSFDFHIVTRTQTYIDVAATIHCSSGTYIRALARDLGAKLKVGGHLVQLRRTSIGPFDVTDAAKIAELPAKSGRAATQQGSTAQSATGQGATQQYAGTPGLLSCGQVAAMLLDTHELTQQQVLAMTYGQQPSDLKIVAPTALLDADQRLVATVAPQGDGTVTHAVFMQPEEIGK